MEMIERDLTTPAEVCAELTRLQKAVGTPNAHASIVLGNYGSADVSLYASWCGSAKEEKIGAFGGDTFSQMLQNAWIGLDAWRVTRKNDVIRRMALAIIELTDEHTECRQRDLERKGFSTADIAEYQERACARAGEIAGNAPFVVVA